MHSFKPYDVRKRKLQPYEALGFVYLKMRTQDEPIKSIIDLRFVDMVKKIQIKSKVLGLETIRLYGENASGEWVWVTEDIEAYFDIMFGSEAGVKPSRSEAWYRSEAAWMRLMHAADQKDADEPVQKLARYTVALIKKYFHRYPTEDVADSAKLPKTAQADATACPLRFDRRDPGVSVNQIKRRLDFKDRDALAGTVVRDFFQSFDDIEELNTAKPDTWLDQVKTWFHQYIA